MSGYFILSALTAVHLEIDFAAISEFTAWMLLDMFSLEIFLLRLLSDASLLIRAQTTPNLGVSTPSR